MSHTIYGNTTMNGVTVNDMVDDSNDRVFSFNNINYFVRFNCVEVEGEEELKPGLGVYEVDEPFHAIYGKMLPKGEYFEYLDNYSRYTEELEKEVNIFMNEFLSWKNNHIIRSDEAFKYWIIKLLSNADGANLYDDNFIESVCEELTIHKKKYLELVSTYFVTVGEEIFWAWKDFDGKGYEKAVVESIGHDDFLARQKDGVTATLDLIQDEDASVRWFKNEYYAKEWIGNGKVRF